MMEDSRTVNWLIYIGGTIVCLWAVGYTDVDFARMLNLNGDTIPVNNFAKSYINGYGFRINPSLGYPGVQDNSYFPTFDFSYRLFLRIVGRFVEEAATSYHALYFSGVVAMFAAATAALRRFDIRPIFAVVGSIVYVISPFFFSRILAHDFLSLYFAAPLGVALALLIGTSWRETTLLKVIRDPFIIVAVLVTATSGLYYGYFTCMFAAFVGAATAIAYRRWRPAVLAALLAGIILPVLVLTGYGFGIADVFSNRVIQVRRVAYEQILYGLNPAEAVGAFAQIPGLGFMVANYRDIMPLIPGSVGLLEWPGVVLSLIILASPLTLALIALSQNAEPRDRRQNILLLATLCIVFGMLYAYRGGLGYYFNLLVVPHIRATERIIPFLSFFALVGILTVVEIAARARPIAVRLLIPFLILSSLVLSSWPSAWALARKQKLVLSNKALIDSIASTRSMLIAKDRAGASVILQLPHVSWPEMPGPRGFDPYAHQDGYVLDKVGSKTRWSYGSAKEQPANAIVQKLVSENQGAGLGAAAQNLGFDAILIEKGAYEDAELASWRKNIEPNLSPGCKVFDDAFRVLYILKAPLDAKVCMQ